MRNKKLSRTWNQDEIGDFIDIVHNTTYNRNAKDK